ncbi:MAG: N-acetylmuramoyl-L-alanine amidase [Bacteroidia bacterium]
MKITISIKWLVRIIYHYSLVMCFVGGTGVVFGQKDKSVVINFPDSVAKDNLEFPLYRHLFSQNSNSIPPFDHLVVNLRTFEIPLEDENHDRWVSIAVYGKNVGLTGKPLTGLYYTYSNGVSSHIGAPVPQFHEQEYKQGVWQSNLVKIPNGASRIQLLSHFTLKDVSQGGLGFDSIRFHFFQPDPNFEANPPIAWAMQDECGCPLPQHVTRTGWGCPDGQNPSCSSPVTTTVTHLIVHHSATPNNASNWANVVRSIWNFHTGNNGWCDIGYNWLIDPNGVIYEGRGGGDNIRGAHFCGTNTGTMGICLLGDYQVDTPTDAALRSLERLLAWKACREDLGPQDTTFHTGSMLQLPVVTGHRLGCGTTCPGQQVYDRLAAVRQGTQDTLDLCPVISSLADAVELGIHLYPNPATDHIVIDHDRNLDAIRLLNAAGQLVKTFDPQKTRHSLEGIAAGIYVVDCIIKGQSIQMKLLVR